MRTLKMAVAAACLVTAAVAGPSLAFDRNNYSVAPEASTERLEVGNVDFRDPAQVRDFHKRLQQAAMFVCGVQSDTPRAQREAAQSCADAAVRQTVNNLDRPLLTATYQQSGAPMVARGY